MNQIEAARNGTHPGGESCRALCVPAVAPSAAALPACPRRARLLPDDMPDDQPIPRTPIPRASIPRAPIPRADAWQNDLASARQGRASAARADGMAAALKDGPAVPPHGEQAGARPATPGRAGENILVVKLGAFGNIVLSFRAFAAIRNHHADAAITVLTGAAYAPWLRTFPWFDHVLVDPRPDWWDLSAWRRLRRMLEEGRFARAYDLQTSARSSRYFHLFPPGRRPEWSGIAYGCALPDRDPRRNRLHDADRQLGQLRQAGITSFPDPDLSWLRGDIARFALPPTFALLVPGSSPHRPAKRWPAAHFQALAERLSIPSVIIGTAAEQHLARQIPAAINLIGQTGFGDLAELARRARCAVGNDTGPMHLIAAVGCPTLTLFSASSDPGRAAPVGPLARVLQRADLADLPVEAILGSLPQ
jgi:ADP-heptose:LPS heptosyltransferase